jgi:hypothetical protein
VLASVVTYGDEEQARAAARRLVEAGIGAQVTAATQPGDGEGPAAAVWHVEVLPDDMGRACSHLGIDPPEDLPDDEPAGTPWKLIIGIWLAAMVVVPLVAFWLTYKLGS